MNHHDPEWLRLTAPQVLGYDVGVSKEMVLENTCEVHGQTAPSVRFCHAQIPSSFGQDGRSGNALRTAEPSVFNILPTPRLKTRGGDQVSVQEHDMTTQVATISATPDLEIIAGQITTTSNQVAAHFNKRHDTVLRAIRNLGCSPEYHARNFAEMVNEVEIGSGATRKDPAYRITRDGFTILAMGFTGKEAMQWKEAYITAFNKMEQELLARSTRPANPALDYDRISPAQAQDLKELVHSIAESKVQGFGETWARLHRKFRVNSYLELPATRFAEARDYLLGKLPAEPLALPAPADRLELAFALAAQASAQVQRTVFNAVLAGGDEWQHSRYLLALTHDRRTNTATEPWAKALAHDAMVVSMDELPTRLTAADPLPASDLQLARLSAACAQRMERRAQQRATHSTPQLRA